MATARLNESSRTRSRLLLALTRRLAQLNSLLEQLWLHRTDGHDLPVTGHEDAMEDLRIQTIREFLADIVGCLNGFIKHGVTEEEATGVREFRRQVEPYIAFYLTRASRARKQYVNQLDAEDPLEPECAFAWHQHLLSRSPGARLARYINEALDRFANCLTGPHNAAFRIGRLLWPQIYSTICSYDHGAIPSEMGQPSPCSAGPSSIPPQHRQVYYRNLAVRLDVAKRAFLETFPYLRNLDWGLSDDQDDVLAMPRFEVARIGRRIEMLLTTLERGLCDPQSIPSLLYLGLSFDNHNRVVMRGTAEVQLREGRDMALFEKVLDAEDRGCSAEEIDSVWKQGRPSPSTRSQALRQLRTRIEPLGITIEKLGRSRWRLAPLANRSEANQQAASNEQC